MILIQQAVIKCKDSAYDRNVMDILVEDGMITGIAAQISSDGVDQVISRDNLHVSVGWVDSSVCFGEPGFEERQTIANGIKAAATGGFTTIVLNPNNHPNPENAAGIKYLKSATAEYIVNVLPAGNLTTHQEGKHLAELYDMKAAGAVSFYDFKKGISNANVLKIALQYSSTFKGVIQSYPESADLAGTGMVNEDEFTIHLGLKSKSAIAEETQIARDLAVLAYAGGHLHFPCASTAAGLKMIVQAREKGLNATASVSINNLILDSHALQDFDTSYKLSPPLRSTTEKDQLLEMVMNGAAQMVTSDHTPHNIEAKKREFDQASYGAVGLESLFPVLNKAVGLDKAIELLTGAYAVFTDQKPSIAVDLPANLTLFVPDGNHEISTNHFVSTAQNISMLGQAAKGKVVGVINRGKIRLNHE